MHKLFSSSISVKGKRRPRGYEDSTRPHCWFPAKWNKSSAFQRLLEEHLNSFQSRRVFSAFCFACTEHFQTLVLPSTQEVMKPSCILWFVTLKVKRDIYARKFVCVEEAKATTAMATQRGHQSQEHRASSHGGSLMETGVFYTALVSVYCKSFSQRQRMKFPTRLSKLWSPLPYSYVRSRTPSESPITVCLTGSFWLENLVTLTLKSAHAWQNVDTMPQGIGSKQDFALLFLKTPFFHYALGTRKLIECYSTGRQSLTRDLKWRLRDSWFEPLCLWLVDSPFSCVLDLVVHKALVSVNIPRSLFGF